MIQVRVAGLAVDSRSQPVRVLKPLESLPGEGRLLPIWIGPQETAAILIALEDAEHPPRPLVYDFVARVLDATDAHVERVEIPRLEAGTYYAEVTLRTPDGVRVIDARPSDSVALAVRVGAPIFVGEAVWEEAGIPDETGPDADAEAQVEAFSDFLDSVDPEDFRG